MRDCILLRFKRLETLDALFLPGCHPSSINIFADASDPRRVVGGSLSRSFFPLSRPELAQVLVSPLFGFCEGPPDASVCEPEVL